MSFADFLLEKLKILGVNFILIGLFLAGIILSFIGYIEFFLKGWNIYAIGAILCFVLLFLLRAYYQYHGYMKPLVKD